MEKIKLTNICTPKQWKTIPTSELLSIGYPVYGANGIIGYYNTYNHEQAVITITCRGASCGTINITKPKSYITGNAMCLDNVREDINLKYLYYNLLSFDFNKVISGSAQPQITRQGLEKVEISICPPTEQISIVSILTSIESLILARKKELNYLDELVKARFVEMFGDPNENKKGFPMLTVGDILNFIGGAQPDKKYFEYEPSEKNIRLIQIRDYKTDNYITYIPKSMAKRFCNYDDIMIGRYGPPIFQILSGIEGSYNVALMKATPKIGNKEFIRYFLKQECLFNYLDGLSQRTAGQSGIDMQALKEYPFPYPPIELQEEFERFSKQVNKSKVAIQKALGEAQTLFDSLMQEYFG